MEFRIADTFTDSLARLTGEEQKAVKTAAFDLQLNPANPGMSFHKIEKAKDKNFWSVRVSSDIRLIVHRSETKCIIFCWGSWPKNLSTTIFLESPWSGHSRTVPNPSDQLSDFPSNSHAGRPIAGSGCNRY